MQVLNAQLVKETEEGGYRGRADRRILSGRVVSRNDIANTAIVDVGGYDAAGRKVFLQNVPFAPQTPPRMNDLVSIVYGNSSPHSGIIQGLSVGGGNSDQSFGNGGVISIRSDANPKLKDNVTLQAGSNIVLTQTDQVITISSSALGTPATTVTEVGTANTVGVSTNYAREDHVHRGVNSVKATGNPELYGDVDIQAGTGISVTQSSQVITIANTATVPSAGTGITDVGTANSDGASANFARVDHVHRGVQSLAKSGSSELVGDVTLSAGAGVTLTQTGNDIQFGISAVGSGLTWTKYTVNYNTGGNGDMLPSNQRNINLFTLPVRGLIHAWAWKVGTIFAGPSLSTAILSPLDLSTWTGIDLLSSGNSGTGGVLSGDTYMAIGRHVSGLTSSQVQRVQITLTGCNIVDLTAGSVDLWVLTSALP